MADKTFALDSGTTKGKFVDIGNSLFAKANVPLVKTASGLFLPFPITDAGYYPTVLQAGSDVVGKVGIDPANNLVQLSGSNVEQTNGADVATKSALVAGKTAAGKGVPIQVDVDGKVVFSAAATATIAEIEGKAAHDAAASGNPVQVGGVYRSTDPIGSDGDVLSLRTNEKGEVIAQLSGSNLPEAQAIPITQSQKDATRYAIDKIIETIGMKNITMFLPMWETEGDTLKDLIHPNLTFSVKGATLGEQSPFGKCIYFDGVDDYCMQNPVPNGFASVGGSVQELQNPTAVATQKLKNFITKVGIIQIKIIRKGNPNGNIKLEIRETKDGSAIENGVSSSILCSSVGTSSVTVYNRGFYFANPPLLVNNKQYYLALVYDGNTNADSDNNIGWYYDSAGGYGQGRNYYDGTTWVDTVGNDHRFLIYDDLLLLSDNFSIIVVYKVAQYKASFMLGSFSVNTARPGIFQSASGARNFFAHDGGERVASVYSNALDNFVVNVVTFSKADASGKIKLYENGVLMNSADGNADTAHRPITQPWCIGNATGRDGYPAAGYCFNGYIGPVLITNTVLSEDQIEVIASNLLILRKMGVDV